MATQADVRRIALSLAGAVEASGRFAFEVPHKGKLRGFAWVWMERLAPRKARVPNPQVLAVRVASLGQKAAILSADTTRFFTEPHYNGYPAVLVRLAVVTVAELRVLISEGWRCVAPAELVEQAKGCRAAGKETSRGTKTRSTKVARVVVKRVAKPMAEPMATKAATRVTKHVAKKGPRRDA